MNERYLQLVWLADSDPMKINAYERMPMVEYYILLNKKNEANTKELKKGQKKK